MTIALRYPRCRRLKWCRRACGNETKTRQLERALPALSIGSDLRPYGLTIGVMAIHIFGKLKITKVPKEVSPPTKFGDMCEHQYLVSSQYCQNRKDPLSSVVSPLYLSKGSASLIGDKHEVLWLINPESNAGLLPNANAYSKRKHRRFCMTWWLFCEHD